ncbi:hypothetical protein RUND412_001293 [Rhizina undulata]
MTTTGKGGEDIKARIYRQLQAKGFLEEGNDEELRELLDELTGMQIGNMGGMEAGELMELSGGLGGMEIPDTGDMKVDVV